MNKDTLIIVFDKMTASKMRVKSIFEAQDMLVEDADSQIELANLLSRNSAANTVLIMTIDDEYSDDGIDLIRKLKPMYHELHIIVLTSIVRREFFAKCITEGVSDYLLKPFEEYVLFERTTRLLNKKQNLSESILKFNFSSYLRSEIIKAKKGSYSFTLLKCRVFGFSQDGYTTPDIEYSKYAAHIYEELNSLFWETDIFIQYGADSFIGFFPFCDNKSSTLIEEKLNKKFNIMKDQYYIYRKYAIINALISFPDDGDNVEALFEKLDERITNMIKA